MCGKVGGLLLSVLKERALTVCGKGGLLLCMDSGRDEQCGLFGRSGLMTGIVELMVEGNLLCICYTVAGLLYS